MEKTTREIVAAYGLLKDAKLTKMEDADKFRLIKTLRALHKAADDYEAFRNEALEKLKGEGHDGIVAKAQQWQREGDKTTLTAEERIGVNRYFAEYNSKVEQCLKEEAEAVRTSARLRSARTRSACSWQATTGRSGRWRPLPAC